MAFNVTHSTPSDVSFSATGAAAWDANHTITGTVPGSILEAAWPIGSVFFSVNTTNPNTLLGFGTWARLGEGQVLVSLASGIPAFNTVKASGGSTLVTSDGTITWPGAVPSFTGTPHQHDLPMARPSVTPYFASASLFGVGQLANFDSKLTVIGANVSSTNLIAVSSSLNALSSQTVEAAGIISWPTATPAFSGAASSVVQPFVVVSMWERTA